MNSIINEQKLLKALSHGDHQAFERIVNDYSVTLLNKAFKWTRDKQNAEDLVQDVLLNIWHYRTHIQINTSLEGYLYRMLKNQFLKWVSRNDLHTEAMDHLVNRMDQIQNTILDMMAAHDLQVTLTEAVAQLPENMKKIFILRHEDYSIKEIAMALGLAEQTVKSYNTELNSRIRKYILTKHPDINHSLMVVLLADLMIY